MARAKTTRGPSGEADQIKERWLERLGHLVEEVGRWSEELGWATRVIQVKMEDFEIGHYEAPALLLQEGKARIILEPIARSAPGADGVVDLYLMPAYDDIASLYFYEGGWQLHYMFDGSPSVGTIREAERSPLTKDSLGRVLAEMTKHVSG